MSPFTDASRAGGVAAALGLSIGVMVLAAAPAQADVPAGWSAEFSDSYSRSSAGSWGSDYALSGATAQAGVSGTAAFATLDQGKSLTATVKGVRVADVKVDTTMAVTAGSATTYDLFHGWTARQQANGSGYRARLRVGSDRTVTLGIARVNGSVDTWLKGVALPASLTSGAAIGGELQVTGTSPVTVRARAWPAGTPSRAGRSFTSTARPNGSARPARSPYGATSRNPTAPSPYPPTTSPSRPVPSSSPLRPPPRADRCPSAPRRTRCRPVP